jgi:hypothetical protein
VAGQGGDLLALLFSPCVIFLALIVGAFALDDLGTCGRIIGTIMITVALWGPDLLIARGWAVECSAAKGCVLPPSRDTGEESEPGFPRPWWRRRYAPGPPQMLFLGGLGGVAIGCIVSLYLNESYLRSLLAWGVGYPVPARKTQPHPPDGLITANRRGNHLLNC